ncbi:MAG: histone deacetylase family protein [Pseudomonadales bacterium]|nr:histone deacetylase family protein [Pseudomonadales bacterium]
MLIFTHPACLQHRMQPGHAERPERLAAILAHLERTGLLAQCRIVEPERATRVDLTRVHTPAYLAMLERRAPTSGLVALDPDTALCPDSLEAAARAAGAVTAAVRAVLDGTTTRAFCAVRPPGHHAESGAAMGFCIYNNVAVGAALALTHSGIERVAILDFDVHHGNGSVEMFQDDPRVLVCSSFQHPFYPGRYEDVVRPHIVNTPLPAGTGSDAFRAAIARDWLPALEQHRPDLVFVSAGFDAHRADPLAELELDETDFGWITREIVAVADRYASGSVVSTLEGGYDLAALARSVGAHLEALAD